MNESEGDFQKADIILAEALEQFKETGVSPYVYGIALMEIGIAALTKVGEDEVSIVDQAKQIAARMKPVVGENA